MNLLRKCVIALLVGLTSCAQFPQVTIKNGSGKTLWNVVIVGPVSTNALGVLKPGQQRRVNIMPSAKAEFSLGFDANQGMHRLTLPGVSIGLPIIEDNPAYRVIVTVTSDFRAKVVSGIKGCIPQEEYSSGTDQAGASNRSQRIRSETNRTPSAARSRR